MSTCSLSLRQMIKRRHRRDTLASGGRYISFATDYEVWFSKDNPQLRDFLTLQKIYDKSDNVVILISPKDGKVFTQQTLASVEWLTKQAWQIPFSTRVDSLSNFQYTYANGDDLVVADLYQNAKSLYDADLDNIKQIPCFHISAQLQFCLANNTGKIKGLKMPQTRRV